MADEIIEELWRIKDGIAHEYGYNVDALVTHLKTRELSPGRQVVDLRAERIAGQTGKENQIIFHSPKQNQTTNNAEPGT